MLMSEGFSERKKNILCAVIKDYINTALPVSSNTISRSHNIGLSPATVRNIMAELEEMGYLTQPHTSAGRAPTDKGFRFYVDTLLEHRQLNKKEQERIKDLYTLNRFDINEIMMDTSRILSLFSENMGIVLSPKLANTKIKKLELVLVKEGCIMVIIVSGSGVVYNRIVNIKDKIKQSDIDRMSNFLNTIASGLTLNRLKIKILGEMKKEKNLFDRLLKRALEIGKTAVMEAEVKEDIYIGGRANILNQPEFKDFKTMKRLLKTFEEKHVLINILDQCMDSRGLQVLIGSENEETAVSGCTLITMPYAFYGEPSGTLGVIGPTRMDYAKVIPLVEYTAGLVSNVLQ